MEGTISERMNKLEEHISNLEEDLEELATVIQILEDLVTRVSHLTNEDIEPLREIYSKVADECDEHRDEYATLLQKELEANS